MASGLSLRRHLRHEERAHGRILGQLDSAGIGGSGLGGFSEFPQQPRASGPVGLMGSQRVRRQGFQRGQTGSRAARFRERDDVTEAGPERGSVLEQRRVELRDRRPVCFAGAGALCVDGLDRRLELKSAQTSLTGSERERRFCLRDEGVVPPRGILLRQRNVAAVIEPRGAPGVVFVLEMPGTPRCRSSVRPFDICGEKKFRPGTST